MTRGAIVASLLVLVNAGCSRSQPPPPPEATAPAAAAPATPAPTERRLDTSAVPPLQYAGVVFEAGSGVISPARDGSTVTLSIRGTGPSRAEVPLDGQLTVAFANGTELRTPVPGFGSAEVKTLAISGAVPAGTTWDDARLTVSESGRPPQTVTVGGSVAPPGAALVPSGDAVAPSRYGEAVTYRVTQAALELDGPRSGGFFERTTETERFARIRVTVLNKGAKNGVSIGQEAFEALVGDQSVNAAVGWFARTIAFNQSADFEMVYRVPAQAQAVVLVVGADGKRPGRITLTRTS